MNKKSVYQDGFSTGYDIASENIHDLNAENFTQDDLDKMIEDCSARESDVYRQYSPFEFLAHDINECVNSGDLWDSYDNGVYKGICQRVKEFKRDNRQGYKK